MASMTWSWRYEDPSGAVVVPAESAPEQEPFLSQADAESWVGEFWRELLEAGVAQVTLLEGDRQVYGPMGLTA